MNTWPQIAAETGRGAAWQALEKCALEPTPVATWAFAGAASETLARHRRPGLYFIEDGARGLAAVFPLRHDRMRWRPFGRLATSSWGDMDFLGVPLIHVDHAHAAFRGLFDMARQEGLAALEFRQIPADGAFFSTLRDVLTQHGLQPLITRSWQRAILDATRDPKDWWRRDISGRHRNEWRRRKRRLAERGTLTFERLGKADECMPWLEEFMALEKSGWKGRAGTALACDPARRAFIRRAVSAFHALGRLRFFRLRLDGRTIASTFGFVQQDLAWMVKIAFDENLHRYSPGSLLVIELTQAFMADPDIRLVDSCAAPGHPLVSHLWRERRRMVDVLVPLPHVGRARFALIGSMEQGYRRARLKAARLADGLRQQRRRRQRQRLERQAARSAKGMEK